MGKNGKANLYVDCVSLHDEVTGSCIYCTIRFPNGDKMRFLVDCGLFQEERYNDKNYAFPFDPKEIDFVLVTHNHIDHIGRLPLLYKGGFTGTTYASSITSELMPIALENTANILNAGIKNNSKKFKKVVENSSIPIYLANNALYDLENVATTMNYVKGIEYGVPCNVNDYVTITFLNNGHILGASSILVTIRCFGQEPINLFFTGDYAKENDFFKVPAIPSHIKNMPISVIEEATYGTTSKSKIVHSFRDKVLKAVKNNDTILLLLFSFGRNQEIEYQLKLMQDEGLLPKSIPIFSDGNLSHSYDDFYLKHKNYLSIEEFQPENLTRVKTYEQRQAVTSHRGCKIILTSSGMGNYGPAQFYLPYYISKEHTTIIFGGYTAPDTLGHKLITTNVGSEFMHNSLITTKKAKVYATNEFSSHAKKEDLINLLLGFKDLKSVLINHGETDVKHAYVQSVKELVNPKNIGILSSTECIRIGPYGIIKTFPISLYK